MSVPFLEESFMAEMADGTEQEVVGSGNAFSAVFRTADGRPLRRDPESGLFSSASPPGALGHAAVPEGQAPRPRGMAPMADTVTFSQGLPKPRWQTRLENHRALGLQQEQTQGTVRAPPKRPTIGSYVGLCMLVDFPDSRGDQTTFGLEEIAGFCNQSGYSGFGNKGSVFDYFRDISGGKLSYTTLVLPWYTARRERAHYTDKKRPFGEAARELIVEALEFHRKAGVNFGSLTVDDAKSVYAVNVLYAGEAGDWGVGLWPHASRLDKPLALAAGKSALDYQISALSQQLTLGVYCHENGHMLCDFPDLYAYPGTKQKIGVGRYCLMCLGARADESNPTQVCAYLKYRAGWGEAVEVAPGLNSLSAAKPDRFLIHRKSETEYFILELRLNRGRDEALAGAGLAIWHIDELASNAEPESAPAGHQHAECVMLQADGKRQLELGQGDGDATDLFGPEPNPVFVAGTALSGNWWDGSPSGLQIHAIARKGDDLQFVAQIS